jgi:hypothetical protein
LVSVTRQLRRLGQNSKSIARFRAASLRPCIVRKQSANLPRTICDNGRAARNGSIRPIRGQGTRYPPGLNGVGFTDEYVTSEADLTENLRAKSNLPKPPHSGDLAALR